MEFVPDISAKRAEISPDLPAFIDPEDTRSLSFREVDDQANRFARAMKGLGVAEGDRVAILCHNRVEFFVAMFACMKNGAVLVPLNWRQPEAELAPVVARAAPRLILHDGAFAETSAALAKAQGIHTVSIEEGVPGDMQWSNLLHRVKPGPYGAGRRKAGDLWYLLFTSGTTGLPKAVMQTFGMAWANAVNIGQATELTSTDKSVNYLPLFHTAGINLLTLPVYMTGGSSTILRKFEPDTLLDLVDAGEVSVFLGVPAIYQALSLHPRFPDVDLTRMKTWSSGGAPLPEPVIRTFLDRGAAICSGYGMTETGPTVFLMDKANVESKIGSVGKAQMLAEVRVVNDDGEVSDEGEMQIRGPGVTPGYWNDAAATAKSFTEDGWLKTGDVGKRDSDGYFFIVDRIKDMFISGGENVYPAEVERVLNTHPAILEAIVLGVPDEKWGEVGHGFLIERPGQSLDLSGLTTWCREHLAAYKIPKTFSVVEDFPRTAAGKVQKHILRKQQP